MFHKEILTTDYTMLSNEICNMKIHQHHKEHAKKSQQRNVYKYIYFEMNKIICQTMVKPIFKLIKNLLTWD
jgi:hypothetical protein